MSPGRRASRHPSPGPSPEERGDEGRPRRAGSPGAVATGASLAPGAGDGVRASPSARLEPLARSVGSRPPARAGRARHGRRVGPTTERDVQSAPDEAAPARRSRGRCRLALFRARPASQAVRPGLDRMSASYHRGFRPPIPHWTLTQSRSMISSSSSRISNWKSSSSGDGRPRVPGNRPGEAGGVNVETWLRDGSGNPTGTTG